MTMPLLLLLAGPIRPPAEMAVKPVICKTVEAARGKSGAELAQAVEAEALAMIRQNYELRALLPGDPPVACFQTRARPGALPPGAR